MTKEESHDYLANVCGSLSWRSAALAGKKTRPLRAPHKSLQRLTVAMQVKDTDSYEVLKKSQWN
jgi:hypothetical protein